MSILIANSPGTTPDAVTRLLAEHLSKRLAQRFLVDAKLGGAGIPATVAAARAKPDGYTLYMSGNSPFALHPFMFKSLSTPATSSRFNSRAFEPSCACATRLASTFSDANRRDPQATRARLANRCEHRV